MVMKSSWIGTEESEPVFACRAFRDWVDEMKAQDKHELIALVKKECRAFCAVLVGSVKERLSTTWNYIQALELIDPLGPDLARHTTPAVWDALRDLCQRRDIDFDTVQSDIIDIRADAQDLDRASKTHIQRHLCGYLGERLTSFASRGEETPTPEYDKLCRAVFGIPLTSAFIESLFSKMAYNQSKIRCSLADTTMSSILHLHDTVLPDPQQPLPTSVQLKVHAPRSELQKMRMEKQIGEVVCDIFDDGLRYHGKVTEVRFHEIHAVYMYHVVFEDGDEQDCWRYELEMIKYNCPRARDREEEVSEGSDTE